MPAGIREDAGSPAGSIITLERRRRQGQRFL